MTRMRVPKPGEPIAPRGPLSTPKPRAPVSGSTASDRAEPIQRRPQPRIDFATGRVLPDLPEPVRPRPQPRIDLATGRVLPDLPEPVRPRPQPRIDFATGRVLPDLPEPVRPRPQPRIDFATGRVLPDLSEPMHPRPQPRIDFATGRVLPDLPEPASVGTSEALASAASVPEPQTTSTTLPYREEMEQTFGTSFAGVAAHLGEQEALSPFGARAAAWSETVAFASSAPGRDVVAHELAHIEQLRRAGGPLPSSAVGADHPAEREAAQIAGTVSAGATRVRATAAPGAAVAFDRGPADRGPAAAHGFQIASLVEELAGHVAALESILLTDEGRAETARVVEDLLAQIDALHVVLSAEQQTLVDRARKLVTPAHLVTWEPRTSPTRAPGSQMHRESAEVLLDRSGGGQREPGMQRRPDGSRGTGSAPGASGDAIDVLSLSEAEYEALTGQRAADLPEGELPGLTPPALSGVPTTVGVGSLFTPQTNWYYRVLAPTDPTAAEILSGASLLPRAPDPGFTFQPAPPAEMTFRHLRAGGNVPQVGTDRISTARNLEAFENLLANRGTGEMMRVDIEAARRLGAKFLEQGDIMAHLEGIGRDLELQLTQARAAGRGKNFIARLEGRVQALKRAMEYAETFGEGQGVRSVPSGAMSRVRGGTLPEALAGERAFLRRVRVFRHGGRVLLVVGIATSVARVASAPGGERGRVAAEEVGGWALSLAGAAAGAKGGAALGAALGWETGPGAVVAVILGSLIGGAIGFFAGEAAVGSAFDEFDTKLDEAVLRDYQHFKELNPDATPADYDRIQQAMGDFDTWGIR